MDICHCVSTHVCENVCESPLMKDPRTGCDCINLEEYIELYNHDLDEECKPHVEDECCSQKKFNVFNFYGDVYGDVNGFSEEHHSDFEASTDTHSEDSHQDEEEVQEDNSEDDSQNDDVNQTGGDNDEEEENIEEE